MKVKDFYNEISGQYEDWIKNPQYKVEFLNQAKQIFDKHNIKSGTILDFGCGPGNLKTLLGDGFDYTGIDVADKMLRLAEGKGYKTILGGEEKLAEIPDKSFDYVVSLSALHFIEDIHTILAEFERIARKGWIATLEEVTTEYAKNHVIYESMHDHSKIDIHGATEDTFFSAWTSPTTGDEINARIIFKKLS